MKTSAIEFKKISGHKRHENVAIEFIKKGVDFCYKKKARIDVLIWDKPDSRHKM